MPGGSLCLRSVGFHFSHLASSLELPSQRTGHQVVQPLVYHPDAVGTADSTPLLAGSVTEESSTSMTFSFFFNQEYFISFPQNCQTESLASFFSPFVNLCGREAIAF